MRSAGWTTLILFALAAVAAPPVASAADSFAVRAGRILPVSLDLPWQIDRGVIVVRDGRIEAVGGDVEIPPDLPVIELPDATVVPGLVGAVSQFGGSHRGDESVAAGYRASDAFDRYADYARTLAAGVTTVHVGPGTHRLLTGQGAVVKLGGPESDRIIRAQADLAVNLGPAVYNPPPDVTFPFPASADVAIEMPLRQRPASRMGQLLALEEAIRRAEAGRHPAAYSLHVPALARAWKQRRTLRIRADRAADVLGAIKFLSEQRREGYIVGGAEAEQAAGPLGRAKVPLVYQPQNRFRLPGPNIGRDPAAQDKPPCDFGKLEQVKLALAAPAGGPVADLRLAAVRAAAAGLDPRRTLEAITRTAAEVLGVADRVGSLAPGKDADLLVLTGDPLEVSSHVQRVYVSGRCVFEPPQRGALVVKAGTVWAAPGREIPGGQVLIEQGKITAVGRSVPHPPFARVIDVRPHGFVTPGLIDAHGHLGLQGDRTAAGNDVRLSKLIGAADVTDLRVSGAGITTVLMAPYATASLGSTAAAVKTAGRQRPRRVVRDPAAVLLDVSRSDPTAVGETLAKPLAAGKKYLDAWAKYEKDLKEFLEKKAKGEKTEADEDAKQKEKETEGPPKPDPLSGTWQATISGDPMPETITATIAVQLIGSAVEGRVTISITGMETTGRLSGSFDGKHLSATIDIEIPGAETPPQLEADLVGEDHLKGTIAVDEVTVQVEARRVDKTPVDLKVTRTRRRAKDGRPLPPKVDPALEPLKALLEKKIPAVVKVSTPAQIREVLTLLVDKHELPVALLGAEGASVHAAKLAEKKVTVIVPPAVLRLKRNRDYHQADQLARRGVPIAFQSNLEDGARDLPAVVLYAVERGLDAEQALTGLTIGAARALKIDDRVGSIEPGKDGDLVIFSRHPLREAGRVLRVVVGGQVIDGKEVRP